MMDTFDISRQVQLPRNRHANNEDCDAMVPRRDLLCMFWLFMPLRALCLLFLELEIIILLPQQQTEIA